MSRQKATNYFSHDSNARNDEKLLNLRMHKGAAGYGVYFMILERLREDTNYMSVKDYNILAFDLRVDSQLIKSVVEDFGLFAFTEDGKYFYSESFNRRMGAMKDVGKVRSEAAQKAAQSRWSVKTVSEVIAKDADVVADKKSKNSDCVPPANVNVNDQYLEKFFGSNSDLLDTLLMNLQLTPKDRAKLRKVAEEVVNEWKISEAFHASYQDWSSHLISTIRIKLQKSKPSASDKKIEQEAEQANERLKRERENEERSRKRDEWIRKSVSHEDAKKDPEYIRALQEN